MALPRGFKASANRIALGLRHQMGLRDSSPIDLHQLSATLRIEVVALSQFSDRCSKQVSYLMHTDASDFSSLLLPLGNGARIILVNDAHSRYRQNSNIAHEIAHALLAHPVEILSGHFDSRQINQDIEDEATHLAGCILIPNEGAWQIVKSGVTMDSAQHHYGVSRQMLKYRLGVSGAWNRMRYRR